MVYLAAQQQNKLIQFPVCVNIGVLFTLDFLSEACEKHIQIRFSLQQFRFWSITQPMMLCHVSVLIGAFCLRHRARDKSFLFRLRFRIFYYYFGFATLRNVSKLTFFLTRLGAQSLQVFGFNNNNNNNNTYIALIRMRSKRFTSIVLFGYLTK